MAIDGENLIAYDLCSKKYAALISAETYSWDIAKQRDFKYVRKRILFLDFFIIYNCFEKGNSLFLESYLNGVLP